jgi:hypothetical protein
VIVGSVLIDRDAVAFTSSSVSFFTIYSASDFVSSQTGKFAAGV